MSVPSKIHNIPLVKIQHDHKRSTEEIYKNYFDV